MERLNLEALDRDSLLDLAEQQARRIAELEERLASFDARFEDLERRAMRGAAPFSRGSDKRAQSPKRPGRKGGHGGVFRRRPDPQEITREIDVPLERCPSCDTPLDADTDTAVAQTVIELPEVAPDVIRLVTHRNRCQCCGKTVSSTHPLQVSRARGAASTFLGPRALAMAAHLNKGLGLTMRKTCAVLKDLTGLTLTPGGLAQALTRVANRLAPARDTLRAEIMKQPVLHTDETSWFVGEPGSSLWVMTNGAGTCYKIVPSRSKAAAIELFGTYDGVLVSDCLNLYDNLTPLQQKCYAHHLKRIGEAMRDPGADHAYLSGLRGLLIGAMALKREIPELPPDQVALMRDALERSADRLLGQGSAGRDEKLRMRLSKQRDHLFTFLDFPDVDATNNLAERQLRPAVISRKLSCGNKTQAGARAWEILASLAATCRQTGRCFVDFTVKELAPATSGPR